MVEVIDNGQSVVEGFAPLGGWMMEDGWMDGSMDSHIIINAGLCHIIADLRI